MNFEPTPTFYTSLSNTWPFPTRPVNEIYLYHCSYHVPSYHDDLHLKFNIPLPEKMKNANIKRKAEYLAGRICTKNALSHLGISTLPISQQDRSPLWPAFTVGSITHSHHVAAAIVADTKFWITTGLDIELLLTEHRSKKLASHIVNEQELTLVKDDISFFITLAFSIKESLFKALFPITKKHFYFHDAEIITWDYSGEVSLRLLVDLSSDWKKGTIIKGLYCLKEGYIWSMIGITQ